MDTGDLDRLRAAGIDRQKALDLRLSWKIGPSRDDQPIQRDEKQDGRFRVVSAAQCLDELIAECIGEVGE